MNTQPCKICNGTNCSAWHMYDTYVSDTLLKRGDFSLDWWETVQPRVRIHQKLGTCPSCLADIFSEEWRIIREIGGWKGTQGTTRTDLQPAFVRACAAAKRRGFA